MLNYDNYAISKGRNVTIMIPAGLNVANVLLSNGGAHWLHSACPAGYTNPWEYTKNKSVRPRIGEV